ncbi:MAG: phosphohydrolase [Acidobacteria bacterium]|nr:phosphohydrolase [Acidobacteriota bacterium]
MKQIYTRDLRPNQVIISEFLVRSKEVRLKKSGENYLSLALADKTGEVDAKMWENVEEVHDTFERDDFIKIKAAVQVFRNKPQLTLHKLRRLEDHEVDLADFFPRSARDSEEMWRELVDVIDGMQNVHLKTLLGKIVANPDIAARLKLAPAAKTLHHAYLGGLLEHILSLCSLSKLVVQNYKGIDLDLLLTGVVLHDLGKIYELSYSRSFNYTSEGQLLGHMILEIEIVHRALAEIPDFPRPLQTLLEHLIISHHGQYEFGSPKLPMFPEALMLHYLDDMDSKIQGMQSILARDQSIEGDWTGYLPSLGRPLLKMQRFLDGNAAAPEVETVAVPQPETEPAMSEPVRSEGAPPPTAVPVAANAAPSAQDWKAKLRQLRDNKLLPDAALTNSSEPRR